MDRRCYPLKVYTLDLQQAFYMILMCKDVRAHHLDNSKCRYRYVVEREVINYTVDLRAFVRTDSFTTITKSALALALIIVYESINSAI